MNKLTMNDLETQGEQSIAIDEASRIALGEDWPRCLACDIEIQFDDQAMETITFRRMCEDRQSIFSCPVCRCRHVIFAEGEVSVTSDPACVTVHPPDGGYVLAKALEQSSKNSTEGEDSEPQDPSRGTA